MSQTATDAARKVAQKRKRAAGPSDNPIPVDNQPTTDHGAAITNNCGYVTHHNHNNCFKVEMKSDTFTGSGCSKKRKTGNGIENGNTGIHSTQLTVRLL